MEDGTKKKLINETVTGRRLTLRRILRYAVIAAVCGISFGAAAGLALEFSDEAIDALRARVNQESAATAGAEQNDVSGGENAADNANVTIGTVPGAASDAGKAADASAGGGLSVDANGGNADGTGNPAALAGSDTGISDESDINYYSSNSPYPITAGEDEKYKSQILSLMPDAAAKISDSLVAVNVTSQTNTWFDSELESTETYAGIILSIDDKEILILAPDFDADGRTVKVTFANGSSADAYLKQSSVTDGLSVVAVSAADGISSDTLDSIEAVEYGDVEKLAAGTAVIAVGAPLGIINSCSFGFVGYVSDAEPGVDCSQYVFYTDVADDASKGTFIIDYDGSLLGLASPASVYTASGSNYARIVGISSLERTINSLMAGSKKAALGIVGMDVDFDMRYSNVPDGVYVSDVVSGSPAYTAGIRHGDVITAVSERGVSDLASLSRILGSLKPGVSTTVKLMRGSVNSEYRELDFELILGER